ncbi:T9SS C-terminal target domain-containing protein [Flavobacterium suaedae]|uniref:T9SS C-terminal target domain-containing protein n=1 Tax=Flavobacterium suaedae TaxID=1767027 RepID=A0ABQ1JKW9_9FLAO|nr:T9SS type A sorting domain-containing protein [Flavobacterium suaedae]GGB69324.1 T9SS C-terminal target domain-containing protein [Flavobacterium suaedae]
MKQKYIYSLIACALFSVFASAQTAEKNKPFTKQNDTTVIEGLNIYPNPTSADRVYISSKNNTLSKDVEIYDVLGKKILQTTISGKELSISNIPAGVYIIKIKEGEATATRKLIIK